MKKTTILLISISLVLLLSACQQQKTNNSKDNKSNFIQDPVTSALFQTKGTILFFFKRDGAPCLEQDRILKKFIIPEFENTIEFKYIGVEKKENEALLHKYGIRALPSLVLLNSKNEVSRQFPPGIQGEEVLKNIINSL